jgi:cytochrome c-type biogenesis protein CcmH/NrfF
VDVARRARRLVPFMLIVVFVVVEASAFGVQPKTTLEKVGSQVYCQCGCATTLNHCPHLPSQCASRAELTAMILKDIQQGKDEPAILQDLARRYGVRVLASPPAKGFDLAVWVLPGFGLVIGLFAVILIVRHLRRKQTPEQPKDECSIDAKIMAAVEEEMDRTVPSVVNDK